MEDGAYDLDEILNEIKADRPEPRLPRSLVLSQMVGDSNPERNRDKSYSRVVKLQCTRCKSTWHACYEGQLPRHRSDLICYRCSR